MSYATQCHLIDEWARFRPYYAALATLISRVRAPVNRATHSSGTGSYKMRVMLTSGTIAGELQLARIRDAIGLKDPFVHVTASPIARHISIRLVPAASTRGIEVSKLRDKCIDHVCANAVAVQAHNDSTRAARDAALASATETARIELDELQSTRDNVAGLIAAHLEDQVHRNL